MSQDKFFSDTVGDKISGDDDLDDLAKNGKGLVTGRVSEDKEKPAWLASFKRYYCSNCRTGVHNTPENDQRCKRHGCDCKCRTHYIGQDGIARPYGIADDSLERAKRQKPDYSKESDAEFQKLMEEYRLKKQATEQEAKKETAI